MCLGGFRNLRRDYSWEGFKLELDETQFEWGTVFEIEVETVWHTSPVLFLVQLPCAADHVVR